MKKLLFMVYIGTQLITVSYVFIFEAIQVLKYDLTFIYFV